MKKSSTDEQSKMKPRIYAASSQSWCNLQKLAYAKITAIDAELLKVINIVTMEAFNHV